jgi:signal transduction histidine kinase/CheY-like chemotaxis protein
MSNEKERVVLRDELQQPAELENGRYPPRRAPRREAADGRVAEDITAQRHLEEELAQAQKLEVLGAFASGVAHDFNNVLQAILGCVNIAREPSTPSARSAQLLDHAAAAAKRGGELTAQLLTFTRKSTPIAEQVAIDELISSMTDLLARLVTEQVSICVDLDAARARVFCAAVHIEQILMNLAANGRDAMPNGGTLSIHTEVVPWERVPRREELKAHPTYLRMTVRDTGVGMTAATMAKVFDPFFTTKPVGKGTGLGLSTVISLVKQHAGRVDLTSEEHHGAELAIYLPCVQREPVAVQRAPPLNTRFSGCALIVEDDALVRTTVAAYMRDLGFDVLEARDAILAYEASAKRHIDVLVSDVLLPGGTLGPQMAARIKREQPNVEVVFVSANADLEDEELRRIGSAVLRKPFEKDELARVLSIARDTHRAQTVAAMLPHAAPSTILLVDDEPTVRLALHDLFEGGGYRVIAANSAARALQLLDGHEGGVDLLVTDLGLPDVPGDALAEQVRARFPRVSIVITSVMPTSVTNATFLQKPFDSAEIMRLVQRILTAAS